MIKHLSDKTVNYAKNKGYDIGFRRDKEKGVMPFFHLNIFENNKRIIKLILQNGSVSLEIYSEKYREFLIPVLNNQIDIRVVIDELSIIRNSYKSEIKL